MAEFNLGTHPKSGRFAMYSTIGLTLQFLFGLPVVGFPRRHSLVVRIPGLLVQKVEDAIGKFRIHRVSFFLFPENTSCELQSFGREAEKVGSKNNIFPLSILTFSRVRLKRITDLKVKIKPRR